MKIVIPEFASKEEKFSFLIKNKESLIAQKKGIIKYTDGISFSPAAVHGKSTTSIKENAPVMNPGDELKVKVVINTTNLMDSHSDVHIPGLWAKSLSENKSIMHLQEHRMAFDMIISDGNDLKAYTETLSWKDLGQNFHGVTEALIFESNIRKTRNEFMLEQYANGFVKQHSVGMRYIQLGLAINDPSNGAEFEMWEKYFREIANQDEAEKQGYFWVVKEAKVIEGSAVPLGSNWITPTLDNNQKEEPTIVTQTEEPSKDTQEKGFFDNW
jgi:hypothetical protein